MNDAFNCSLETQLAIASAVATSIASVILCAPASSNPRSIPGNAKTLLIWFGWSLRPVATTAAYLRAITGSISGSGLAYAKTIESFAIEATSDSLSTLGALTPMKISVPTMHSERVPLN